jgi:hypothetical protein
MSFVCESWVLFILKIYIKLIHNYGDCKLSPLDYAKIIVERDGKTAIEGNPNYKR